MDAMSDSPPSSARHSLAFLLNPAEAQSLAASAAASPTTLGRASNQHHSRRRSYSSVYPQQLDGLQFTVTPPMPVIPNFNTINSPTPNSYEEAKMKKKSGSLIDTAQQVAIQRRADYAPSSSSTYEHQPYQLADPANSVYLRTEKQYFGCGMPPSVNPLLPPSLEILTEGRPWDAQQQHQQHQVYAAQQQQYAQQQQQQHAQHQQQQQQHVTLPTSWGNVSPRGGNGTYMTRSQLPPFHTTVPTPTLPPFSSVSMGASSMMHPPSMTFSHGVNSDHSTSAFRCPRTLHRRHGSHDSSRNYSSDYSSSIPSSPQLFDSTPISSSTPSSRPLSPRVAASFATLTLSSSASDMAASSVRPTMKAVPFQGPAKPGSDIVQYRAQKKGGSMIYDDRSPFASKAGSDIVQYRSHTSSEAPLPRQSSQPSALSSYPYHNPSVQLELVKSRLEEVQRYEMEEKGKRKRRGSNGQISATGPAHKKKGSLIKDKPEDKCPASDTMDDEEEEERVVIDLVSIPKACKDIDDKRSRASPEQIELLERVFSVTPLPTAQTKAELAERTGMSQRRIQVWFQNKRARLKRLGIVSKNKDPYVFHHLSCKDGELEMRPEGLLASDDVPGMNFRRH